MRLSPRLFWILQTTAALLFSAILIDCAGPEPTPATERYREAAPASPAAANWTHVVNRINQLDEKKASKEEWASAATTAHPIADRRDLGEILAPLKQNENDHRSCQVRYLQSAEAVSYGFEGDHHALVFFDESSKATHVMKW